MISRALRGLCMAAAMLIGAPTYAAAVECVNGQPLQLGDTVMTLPSGMVDQPYSTTLRATGGTPPYTYAADSLPPGMTLSSAGELSGLPSALPLVAVFIASVRDQHGCLARQTYKLAILAPRAIAPIPLRPKAPAIKPEPRPQPPVPTVLPVSKPAPPEPLTTVPLIDTLAAPSSPQSMVDVYVLTDDIFKDKEVLAELKRRSADVTDVVGLVPATEAAPAPATSTAKPEEGKEGAATTEPEPPRNEFVDPTIDADAQAQFRRMLAPLVGVEFPGKDLFEAALDQRLCFFSRELIVATANRQHVPPPAMSATFCPPAWGDASSNDDAIPPGHLPWEKVPEWLMGSSMHAMLIDKARQSHSLLHPVAPSWSGAGCGCVRALNGQIYGFYPYWDNGKAPRQLDFSMLSRISVFALWFADDGDLMEPGWTSDEDTAFIREAQRQETALDYTLYHNDWRFLKDATDDDIKDATERLAAQATNFIDTPLTDPLSRAHAWVPGFAREERNGSGLTLFLDRMPAAGDSLRHPFERYLNQQVRQLIAEMRRRKHAYVLNIVLRDSDLTGTGAIWQPTQMAEFLRQAEAVDPRSDSMPGEGARQRSSTNVTLRYMVLVTQPGSTSMRKILTTIDRDKDITEEACRILLRRVIPVLSTGASVDQDLTEDLSYASDNFGGAGFWSAPVLDDTPGKMTSARIGRTFLPHAPTAESLNGWICEHRWILRILVEAVLLIWLIAFLIYQSSCRMRQIGLPFQLALLAGAILFLVLGALLLLGDPALVHVRQGNALLALLLIALIAVVAYHVLKPRVEKP